MSADRDQALRRAKQHEDAGQHDEAARAYVEGGSVPDAARVLTAQGRYLDAGAVLFRDLGVNLDRFDALPPHKRKQAMTSAFCFARAGRHIRAAEIFVALGETARAIEHYERAGDADAARRLRQQSGTTPGIPASTTTSGIIPGTASGIPMTSPGFATVPGNVFAGTSSGTHAPAIHTVPGVAVAPGQPAGGARERIQKLEQGGRLEEAMHAYATAKHFSDAARLATQLSRQDLAGGYFLEAGMPFEAAGRFREIRDMPRYVEALIRVPREHPAYRSAVLDAIQAAPHLGKLDFRFDQFISRFLQTAPETAREVEALHALGHLYRHHNQPEAARDAYRKILAKVPTDTEAVKQLNAIDTELRRVAASSASRAPGVGPRPPAQPPPAARTVPRAVVGAPTSSGLGLPDLPSLPELPGLPPVIAPMVAPSSNQSPRASIARPGVSVGQGASAGPRSGAARSAVEAPTSSSAEQTISVDELFSIGTLIADRYKLRSLLGRGGMANVYRAQDLELGIDIAMKVFAQQLTQGDSLRRFKQELVLSRQLTHPNILRLYDIGAHKGFRYLTMELLEGAELKVGGKAMNVAEGLGVLLQACAGLQTAHEQNIVHRDVKPANLFITKSGVVKVMDFGIARSMETPRHTLEGTIAGTPAYMAPEQIDGFEKVSPATDLYSLGIVAYEMFTGKVPFWNDQMMKVLMMHMQDIPTPLRSINPAVPRELEAVVLRLLEKMPKDRPQSCRELADSLEMIRRSLTAQA